MIKKIHVLYVIDFRKAYDLNIKFYHTASMAGLTPSHIPLECIIQVIEIASNEVLFQRTVTAQLKPNTDTGRLFVTNWMIAESSWDKVEFGEDAQKECDQHLY